MTRRLKDWLDTYIKYTKGTEAPAIMHTFAGVAAIASALRRKVWIDQLRFVWYPSFYIVFVADPGIVTKSSSIGLAEEIVRSVPGLKFGPDSVTWESLVTSFAGACESFEHNGQWYPMSALSLYSSEFGSLMDLSNTGMVNLFVELWDGKAKYDKQTKMSGCDTVEAPWINLIAGTTPSWITLNMNRLATAGGLTSRTIYVFADRKENLVVRPRKTAPGNTLQLKADLMHDLEYISVNLSGEFSFTAEAEDWEEVWYKTLWTETYHADLPDWQKGYLARRHTHLNKLAMILSVSRSDDLQITLEDYIMADVLLQTIEGGLSKVFSQVGLSSEAVAAEKFIDFVRRAGVCDYQMAYRMVQSTFPDFRDFEGIVSGAVRSGYVQMTQAGTKFILTYTGGV